MNINKIKKSTLGFLIAYLVYALICSVFIFRFHQPIGYAHENNQTTERFLGEEISQDRVVLLEDGMLAGLARIDLIEQAKDTIDIAYYSIDNGTMANVFLGGLINAADRGVQVHILLDGLVNNISGKLKDTIYAITNHPNMELKFYEPLNLLKPWTWNNRLHDKLIMVDDEYAIIGGRNLGDKYFIKENNETEVNDRDVMILNTKPTQVKDSVIDVMKAYFNTLWTHDFTKYPVNKLSNRQIKKGEQQTERLSENLHQLKASHPDFFEYVFDWHKLSVPTKNITFIHNPIQRMNKEPWVWSAISDLLEDAEDSVRFESPYIIPTKKMLNDLDRISVPPENVTIGTNSMASTPNPLAFSGYLSHSKRFINSGFNILEYAGPNSIHGKTYTFDNRVSAIGSFNLDARSTFLSTESMVVIDSTDFANILTEEMNKNFPEQSMNMTAENESVPFMKVLFLEILSVITSIYHHIL